MQLLDSATAPHSPTPELVEEDKEDEGESGLLDESLVPTDSEPPTDGRPATDGKGKYVGVEWNITCGIMSHL